MSKAHKSATQQKQCFEQSRHIKLLSFIIELRMAFKQIFIRIEYVSVSD